MKKDRQPVDKVFLALVLVELFFGLMMLTSASMPLSYDRFHSGWYYARHQLLFGVIPGLAGLFVLSRIDYRRWQRLAMPVMVAALFLMIMVFVPGLAAGYGTAKSWIMVGGLFSIQPVEFLKLALVVYIAALAARAGRAPREIFMPAVMAFGASAIL
jgi:cell division protein FtsW